MPLALFDLLTALVVSALGLSAWLRLAPGRIRSD
jgi:hypothetical protein